MKIKVTGLYGKDRDAFASVIDRAARESGMTDDQVLLCLTHIFESIADHVSRGGILTIPGFGKFAAVFIKHYRNRPPSMLPRFSPSVGFLQQTRLCAPQSTRGNTALQYHKSNHHLSTRRPSARVLNAAASIRDSIRAQMAAD